MNPEEPKPNVKAADPKPEPPESKPAAQVAVPPAESKTESKPEVKTEPKADDPAAKPAPDPKAVALTRDPKAEEPKPEAKTESKDEVKPASKPVAKVGSKPEVKTAETKNGIKAPAPKTALGNKIIFTIAALGILAGLVAAYIFGMQRKAQPPVFKPVSNPFESAIYANGMVESEQTSGENINIFPEVSGPITQVLVSEGQKVAAGTPLLTIDDSVQKGNTEQLRLQAAGALELLKELKAQPRKETLAISASQVKQAESVLESARDQYEKRLASYKGDPRSISKDVVDTAADAAKPEPCAKTARSPSTNRPCRRPTTFQARSPKIQ